MVVRTRIAPSPTGIAHLGTAYQAQRDYAFAKKRGGQFIVRIEDTDRERYVEGAVSVIFEAFKWLGYQNDEGLNVGGPYAPYVQSERLPIYKKYAEELVAKGKAYYCFCTKERLESVRTEQLKKKELPRYDKFCRHLDPAESLRRAKAGEPHVIRLAVPESGDTIVPDTLRGDVVFQNAGIDDQVLLKSDGYPTYHLGVVVDDYLMKITHIIRGEEWLSSAPKHVLIYEAFGWPLPSFTHLPIIRNKDHSKMSKRHNDVSILSYREKGYLPEAMNNYLALMGWSHPEGKELFTLDEFVELFSLDRVTLTAPVFDLDKLNWYNGHYLREKSDAELVGLLRPFAPANVSDELLLQIAPLVKPRLVTLADFDSLAGFFFAEPEVPSLSKEDQDYLAAAKTVLQSADWTKDSIETQLLETVKTKGWKNSPFFAALRLTVTGKKISPPLTESMLILGRKKVLERIDKAL